MRTTIQAWFCSLAVACAPVGGRSGDGDVSPDAGSDGGTSAVCDSEVVKTMDITINGTAGFTNLPTTCWRLNGKLTLTGTGVTSVEKLDGLRGVRDLVLAGTDLTRFDTRSPIEVSGALAVRNNNKLTDVTNINVTPTVQSITIENNPELTGIGGLGNAGVVAGETRITSNPKLGTINLGTATRLEGGLLIQDNTALTSIDLHSLQSIANFTIRNNQALTSIGSLSALQFVHGTLTIDNNDNLVSLANTMSSTLARIDISVAITGNAKLGDLGSLARIKYVEGGVVVTGNSALPYCEIREIDCCVDTGAVTHSGNQTSSCNISGYSWCVQELGACPFM